MKLLLRTMFLTWSVMALLALLAILWPSVIGPNRERSIPLGALEECAQLALQRQLNAPTASQGRGSYCRDGKLVKAGARANTDLAGQTLSSADIRREQLAERDGLVVANSPANTFVAFRVESTQGKVYVYLTTFPAARPFILFRRLDVMSPIFIAGFLSLLVAAYVVGPITRLNTAAEQLGGGDLKVRINSPLTNRRDELGDLARTFNGMAERIESLVTHYRDFLAHASHELGSPLTRLNIALALAQRKAGNNLGREHERISQEAYRLNSLVQEMLLLARLESGNEVNKETSVFSVRSIVTEAYENAKFEADQMKKLVTIDGLDDFEVRGYPVLLQRALDNVLRNALRFAETHVSIMVAKHQARAACAGVIRISDDGPGIGAGQEETIFEPFVTLSGTEPDGVSGGSGLGLAIARQAVSANGGTIKAERLASCGLLVEMELPAFAVESSVSMRAPDPV